MRLDGIDLFLVFNQDVLSNPYKSLYDSLRITAYSSGYCLGSANWAIDCGYEKVCICVFMWFLGKG